MRLVVAGLLVAVGLASAALAVWLLAIAVRFREFLVLESLLSAGIFAGIAGLSVRALLRFWRA